MGMIHKSPPMDSMEHSSSDSYLNLERAIDEYRRRAILAIQTAFLVGATFLFIYISGRWEVVYSILVSALLSATSIGLTLKGRIAPAAMILALQFLVLPTYLAFSGLGTFDSAFLIYPAGMLAISVVGRPRQTAAFALVTMACATLVAYGTLNNWIGNKSFSALVAENPVDLVATLVITAFAGVVATFVSSILTGLLKSLAEHQTHLEDRIDRRTRELANSNDELRLAMGNLDKARSELVRGEKLAGLGSLVAGVAHELNTPIGNTAVAASTLLHLVEEFKRQVESGNLRKSELQSFLSRCEDGSELIVSATHRARDLVASFKQVAVDQTSDRRREFDAGEVIQDVLRSMRPSFKGKGWTIDADVPAGILCDGYPGPLGQVITNLIQNAVVHGVADLPHGKISVTARLTDATHFEVVVSDNGKGIPASVIDKIFDPFFTTRLGQGGSGLGLTIVHNLVTAVLGGTISVRSTVGEGSQFTVTLPLNVPVKEASAERLP